MAHLALVTLMTLLIVTLSVTVTSGQVTFSKGSWAPNGKRSQTITSSQHRKPADNIGTNSKQSTVPKKIHYETYESRPISLFARLLAKQLNGLLDDIPSNQRKEYLVSRRTEF